MIELMKIDLQMRFNEAFVDFIDGSVPGQERQDKVDKFNKTRYFRRHNMKPGITGLWQVSGRNELREFEDWIKLDLEYIDDWSLWLDIKIIFKTIPVVLFGTGK